jgi:hypothetical protein
MVDSVKKQIKTTCSMDLTIFYGDPGSHNDNLSQAWAISPEISENFFLIMHDKK